MKITTDVLVNELDLKTKQSFKCVNKELFNKCIDGALILGEDYNVKGR